MDKTIDMWGSPLETYMRTYTTTACHVTYGSLTFIHSPELKRYYYEGTMMAGCCPIRCTASHLFNAGDSHWSWGPYLRNTCGLKLRPPRLVSEHTPISEPHQSHSVYSSVFDKNAMLVR